MDRSRIALLIAGAVLEVAGAAVLLLALLPAGSGWTAVSPGTGEVYAPGPSQLQLLLGGVLLVAGAGGTAAAVVTGRRRFRQ